MEANLFNFIEYSPLNLAGNKIGGGRKMRDEAMHKSSHWLCSGFNKVNGSKMEKF